MSPDERDALSAENERLRGDKATFERWRDEWISRMEELERALAFAEDRAESAEAEVERLRVRLAKVEALADEWFNDFHPAHVFGSNLRAALADAPTEQTECLGLHVSGQMWATLCDEDGWVRAKSGGNMWHYGTDYKCTGSVHPPLDSPIWPGREVRCANPIHVVKWPTATPGTVTIDGTATAPTGQTKGGE